VKAVFEGADGLIAGGAGKLFVEMSTVRRDRGFPIRDLSWGA
jgi:hypothetical protein